MKNNKNNKRDTSSVRKTWKDSFEVFVALGALALSVVAIAQSCSANRIAKESVDLQKQERIQTRTDQLSSAKKRLTTDLEKYQTYVRTYMTCRGVITNASLTQSEQAKVFEDVFNSGIHGRVVNDVIHLRELGFDMFLKQSHPDIDAALETLCNENLDLISPSLGEKGQRIFDLLITPKLDKKIAAITEKDILLFVQSK